MKLNESDFKYDDILLLQLQANVHCNSRYFKAYSYMVPLILPSSNADGSPDGKKIFAYRHNLKMPYKLCISVNAFYIIRNGVSPCDMIVKPNDV